MTTRTADLHQKAASIRILLGDIALQGNLGIPARALGLVIFIHGSGSSRFSPRNLHVVGGRRPAGVSHEQAGIVSNPGFM